MKQTLHILFLLLLPFLAFGQGKVIRHHQQVAQHTTKSKGPANGKVNGHEWVDLGLPSGTKWATCNVGAATPNDYGDYYAWGETSTKTKYNDQNSIAWDKSKEKLLSEGIINSKGILTVSHDVARENWGDKWRVPTDSEWDELVKRCKWDWIPNKGYKITGPNGYDIFLPVAGYKGTVFSNVGESGQYWSSNFHSTGFAGGPLIKADYYGLTGFNCVLGISIRPIISK